MADVECARSSTSAHRAAPDNGGVNEPRTIGVLLFDGFEELDAVGPWEVLAYWAHTYPEDGWTVTTFSRDGTPVTAAKGLVVHPEHSVAQAPEMDVLIYPGGVGTRPQLTDQQHLQWIRDRRSSVPLLASVCTGSLVLAAAGVLDNRPATTHWKYLDQLASLGHGIQVQRDSRFVDDGDVITSAGVSAGIDMALHLVTRFSSPSHARQVRRGIQYDCDPPE